MFESVPVNPPDAIFGLNEEFKRDSNPEKINLTVGMYQDASGKTPVMSVVRKAIQQITAESASRVYLPIDGYSPFNEQIPHLVFGDQSQILKENRARSAQTPGGTGALRISGELLRNTLGVTNIWVSSPTWSNHLNIFKSAGLTILPYAYLDQAGTGFDFQQCLDAFSKMQPNDAVLLHTVCHNPTGVDPTQEQWDEIIDAIQRKNLVPIFDFAYQGFGQSIDEDAYPIRTYCKQGGSALICSSFSKNFNLYGERVGAVTAVGPSAAATDAVHSQVKLVIRSIYSNPPTFGGSIVAKVFNDEELKTEWKDELETMRTRINSMREVFVQTINDAIGENQFDHLLRQRGMFSYSGIAPDVVEILKQQYSVYLLKSGRINVAGINEKNVHRICECIVAASKQAVAG